MSHDTRRIPPGQAISLFWSCTFKGWLHRVWARITRHSSRLLDLDETLKRLGTDYVDLMLLPKLWHAAQLQAGTVAAATEATDLLGRSLAAHLHHHNNGNKR